MILGPMLRHEYRATTSKRPSFAFRTALAVLLGTLTLVVAYFLFVAPPAGVARLQSPERVVWFGRIIFLVTLILELVFLVFLTAANLGGAIAEEREKDTLPLLLLTRLTPLEIVLAKLVARWYATTQLIGIGLPLLVGSAWMAGLEGELGLALLVLVGSSALMAALAILASAQREQAGAARGAASAWITAWLIGPPFVTLMPVTTGSIWGDLLVQLKEVCGWVAPSSPLSLVTDRSWFFRPQAVSLEGQVAWMLGLQALLGCFVVGVATSRLQARERNPNWLDPTRGFRPPCGDDPIYWREFELPTRRGGGSLYAVWLRSVWILIQAILLNLLNLLGTLLALAVPVGLLVATIYYGTAAFRELWQYGYGPSGPFAQRDQFQMLIRVGTGLLALPCLNLPALVTGKITAEREKKSWEAVLTTPLTASEILRSKARAAVDLLRQTARPLPVLWVLGLVAGALRPLGVVLAALDLGLVVWATIALGLYLGVRPGTTSAASRRAALSALVFFVLHTPLLWLALVSPREWAEFNTWPAWIWWTIILVGSIIPVLTAALAWWLTCQTIRRFDEWVGRPCRHETTQAAASVAPISAGPEPAGVV